MAAFDNLPMQFERDLRSAHKDTKRRKDATTKWAYGSRALPGNKVDLLTDDVFDGMGARASKFRPRHKWSDIHHSFVKPNPNIVKCNRANYMLPASRVRVSTNALQEIRDASQPGGDLMWSPTRRTSKKGLGMVPGAPNSLDACSGSGTGSGFLYSFDNTDSPPPVLTLDVFVKPNARATEMLVEKEYEVLDGNGDAVKGRKARQVLRKAAASGTAPAATPNLIEVIEEEDFELV